MTAWRPSSGPAAAATRAALLRRIREYFLDQDVLEVDTPALSPYAVSDPQIESFEIASSQVAGRPLYLHTSPEFHMKRMLADGYPDIYSVCRVFRDGEAGRRHQPEFTLVEWYRRGMELAQIVSDTVHVIDAALGARRLPHGPVVMEYRDAVASVCDIDIDSATTASLADASGADDNLRRTIGDERDDWLDLLLATVVIPTFADDRLTVLRHYPAQQAALARLCPDDPRVADRFEVFCGPVELANGYVELADPDVLAARMADDNAERRRRGRAVRPLDKPVLEALAAGLPHCAGVALGLERLQMIHDRAETIGDVVSFDFQGNA